MVGPNDGEMACGEFGPGRMAEPCRNRRGDRSAALRRRAGPWRAARCLITAGPTHEPIDPVRYIANHSSGKQGYAIAAAAVALGRRDDPGLGPGQPARAAGRADDAGRDAHAPCSRPCEAELPCDIAIFAAAVADWRVASDTRTRRSRRRRSARRSSTLVENPDILKTIATRKTKRPTLVVGFAAETENVIENARQEARAPRAATSSSPMM